MSFGLLVVTLDWSFARLTALVVTTISNTLSSNNIQNGDVPVPVDSGPPGKWPLEWRERERERERCTQSRVKWPKMKITVTATRCQNNSYFLAVLNNDHLSYASHVSTKFMEQLQRFIQIGAV